MLPRIRFRLIVEKARRRGGAVFAMMALLAFLSTQMLACGAAPKVQPYVSKPFGAYKNVVPKNNLFIAVQPITDKAELEKVFGRDLTEAGILPVLIIAENRDSSRSFVLSGSSITLSDKRARAAFPRSLKTDAADPSAGKALNITGIIIMPLAIIPGAVLSNIGGKMISDVTITHRSLIAAELYTRTLSPGKKASGFVYFKLPDSKINMKDFSLLVQTPELGTGAIHNFEFTLQDDGRS